MLIIPGSISNGNAEGDLSGSCRQLSPFPCLHQQELLQAHLISCHLLIQLLSPSSQGVKERSWFINHCSKRLRNPAFLRWCLFPVSPVSIPRATGSEPFRHGKNQVPSLCRPDKCGCREPGFAAFGVLKGVIPEFPALYARTCLK